MVCDLLNRQDVTCSYGTVYSYMQELGLKATIMRKKQRYQKGLKHLSLRNGQKRYNCTILDLYDRSVVATANSRWIDSDLAIETLKKALKTNNISDGLILHSDQGSQYASRKFIGFCADNNITQSMSRAGNPYDNAPMERFYNTLKTGLIYQYYFENDQELNTAVNDYIYDWYNHRRPHTFNNGLTPFEARNLN